MVLNTESCEGVSDDLCDSQFATKYAYEVRAEDTLEAPTP